MDRVIIVGNGIAGITTARTLRKHSDCRITVISSESDFFFSRTALMYVYMGHMKVEHTKPYEDHFWERNRIELVREHVEKIDFTAKSLRFRSGGSMSYTKLVLALGSKPNFFGWPGQDLKGVQGLYSIQDLELLEQNTHPPEATKAKNIKRVDHAVIVGGGLIGIELAEMLQTRAITVTFLVRESRFWGNVLPPEEGELVMRHMRSHGVRILLNTELKEIVGNGDGKVKAIITSDDEHIPCQLVGITAGVRPNVDFLKNTDIEIDRGIVVNEYLQSNISDVYAAGDCAQMKSPAKHRAPIEAVWYAGRMMGEALGRTLANKLTVYSPGVWFNSAKFFDIEYQVYGKVPTEDNAEISTFYWEHPKGEICLRMAFDEHKRIEGMHVLGLRLRHQLLDRWIGEKRKVERVLSELSDANFNTEFYRSFEPLVIEAFNKKYQSTVKLKKRSWKRILKG